MNAGDAAFAFSVSEPTVTHVPSAVITTNIRFNLSAERYHTTNSNRRQTIRRFTDRRLPVAFVNHIRTLLDPRLGVLPDHRTGPHYHRSGLPFPKNQNLL